jgi:transposase
MMINPSVSKEVYVACGTTDLRKSIDGLSAIVKMRFKLDPFSNCLFVFCNKNKNRIKILEWEYTGFWLHLKRLEQGRFRWPDCQEEVKNITQRELRWLLDGLALEQPKAHKEVKGRDLI